MPSKKSSELCPAISAASTPSRTLLQPYSGHLCIFILSEILRRIDPCDWCPHSRIDEFDLRRHSSKPSTHALGLERTARPLWKPVGSLIVHSYHAPCLERGFRLDRIGQRQPTKNQRHERHQCCFGCDGHLPFSHSQDAVITKPRSDPGIDSRNVVRFAFGFGICYQRH